MKHFFSWMVGAALSLGSVAASAQTMPAAPPTSLQGQPLKDWLRQNWYDGKRVVLSYNDARGKMYNFVDNQNGRVVCVYSGYTETVRLDSASTSPSGVTRINCEHTVPQSWFNEAVRMRSDIHHLFPTYDTWNSNRGSDPFAEIPDAQTQLWMRNNASQTTIPTANIDEYSEDTNSQFEPREDHKGNLARAIFYFYTMHQGQAFDPGKDVITAAADVNTLYQWHLADPVDARERERNRRAAKSQGNFNPYIAYPDLVARAWGFQVLPTFSFSAATASIAEGNTGTSTYTATINVTPAPTSALTVQVALDAANSTATAGSDFTFTSPQTLTFAAGQTSQTVTVTVNGDTQAEADETVVLALSNPSTGGAVGGPASQELTITNDDGAAPTIRFASATGSLAEGSAGTSTYTVNVTLSGSAPTANVTIPVTVSSSGTTATSPADYTLSTTSLTFVAGQATQTFPVVVAVVADAQPEPNETVRLVLGTPTTGGAVLGAPSAHVLTITNDDQAPAGSPCTDLFFSEYVEGNTSNTKVIEIYNPSPAPISLAGIEVRLFANGATSPTATQALTGTIAPGDVYVIANTGVASPVVAAQTDLQSNVGFFNGDDALLLLDGTDTLDVIGVIGQQPAGGWQLPGGGSTTNATLVRKATVNAGQKRWSQAASEWQFVGTDVYTNVGSHTSGCITTATTKAAPLNVGIEVFPNPAADNVQVRLPELRGRHTATIRFFNALGQEVLHRTVITSAAETTPVAVHTLRSGLYTVRVTVDGVRYSSRVAVQH
ncbi:endonuclease [Hymenobacter metallilatus]|uniref:T9SS C-terminal target domain-containing protein n=1 Tax=Hymenobacter metallilatus TaxID=2493666 RepID=A0A3R9M9I7_9BACT|nr:endonuclease [Hymenobacter metallilatus]RSK33921.1 T9SS C-terminal target domain-containing protein [Hymenobacter metallilatus]